jgi:predicted  nucleic acid-binding Zn-ribbon protein
MMTMAQVAAYAMLETELARAEVRRDQARTAVEQAKDLLKRTESAQTDAEDRVYNLKTAMQALKEQEA